MFSRGPPELPGLTAASNWISPDKVAPAREGESPVEARDDASGQRGDQAERVADREIPGHRPVAPPPRTAGATTLGSWAAVSTAMSSAASAAFMEPLEIVPSKNVSLIWDAPCTT